MYNLWQYLSTLCANVCEWLATGWWFSPGTPVSSTNKTDRHDMTEILLKVALNTIKQTKQTLFSTCRRWWVFGRSRSAVWDFKYLHRRTFKVHSRTRSLFVCCYCDSKIIVQNIFILFWFHAEKCHQTNAFQPLCS